jgi:hypothetical protein
VGVNRAARRLVFVALPASIVFILCAVFSAGGPLDQHPYGDARLYAHYAYEMGSGRWPYRDFFDEYPVLAQPLFLFVRLLPGHFQASFRWTMVACGVAALVLGTAALRVPLTTAVLCGGVFALSPLLLGPILLNMYDLFPAALTVAAVAAIVAGRDRLGYLALALGVAAKIYPALVLPLALVQTHRRGGRDGIRRALLWFAIPLVLVHLPFAVMGLGGLRFSYWMQLTRGLQTESLAGGLLIAFDRLGIHHVAVRFVPPGSTNALGSLADALAAISSLVAVAAVVLVVGVCIRRRFDLATGAAAAIAAFVAFTKVFSPQYVVWLLPFAASSGAVEALLVASTLLVTHVEWNRFRTPQPDSQHWIHLVAWWIVGRDAIVVVLFLALLRRLMSRECPEVEPAAP